MERPEIQVKDLRVSFITDDGRVQAVRGVDFEVGRGETLAIVGESGSGKSVTSKAIMGLLAPEAVVESGEILFAGRDLLKAGEKELNMIRGNRISMIFQDPMSSLNPIMRIGEQLTEAMLLRSKKHRKERGGESDTAPQGPLEYREKALGEEDGSGSGSPDSPGSFRDFAAKLSRKNRTGAKARAKEKALRLMREVGIPDPELKFNQYPFEFSGGMRQRIVIAIALASDPEILICDEPTTALDVTIQAQILELINRIKKERKLSVIFITHDLGVVANMADRIAVMYAGKIVEYGRTEEIFYQAAHPYTWALLSSMPDMDTKDRLEAIPGTTPNMAHPPEGDAFASRNRYALEIDFEQMPPMFRVSDTHYAATWLLHPDAPKVEMPAALKERTQRMRERYGREKDE